MKTSIKGQIYCGAKIRSIAETNANDLLSRDNTCISA